MKTKATKSPDHFKKDDVNALLSSFGPGVSPLQE